MIAHDRVQTKYISNAPHNAPSINLYRCSRHKLFSILVFRVSAARQFQNIKKKQKPTSYLDTYMYRENPTDNNANTNPSTRGTSEYTR